MPPAAGNTGYYNPAANNNPQAFPPQQQFQTSAVPNQQQQYWPGQTQQQSFGYAEQPAPVSEQRQPEPPKEKPPLPEEYIYLQTVLEELKNQCLAATNDPVIRHTFRDCRNFLIYHLFCSVPSENSWMWSNDWKISMIACAMAG